MVSFVELTKLKIVFPADATSEINANRMTLPSSTGFC